MSIGKWIILDLEVTRYFLSFRTYIDEKGETKLVRTRLYRYGKTETVENDLGKKRGWRVTLPKSELINL